MFLVNSSSRYNFSRKNRDDAATRYLTIKDLQSSDKGVYKCIVEKDDGTFTKKFTLRVRGEFISYSGTCWVFYRASFSGKCFIKIKSSPREKCPYSEFCWSVISGIRTEYRQILRSPYSMQMQKNRDQKDFEYGHFSHSASL